LAQAIDPSIWFVFVHPRGPLGCAARLLGPMGAAHCTTAAGCCSAKDGEDAAQPLAKVHTRSTWAEDVVEDASPAGGPTLYQEPTAQSSGGFKESAKIAMSQPEEINDEKENNNATARTPKSGNEFLVMVERSLQEVIGLNLDVTDGLSLVIVDILPGVVQTWNEKHPNAPRLQINDRVIEANGMRGDAKKLMTVMKQSTVWTLMVQRPVEVEIVINRSGLIGMGIDLRYAPNGTSLMITEVDDGPFKDWNQCSGAAAQIQTCDRIIEVNGTRGSSQELLKAGLDLEALSLKVLHYG